MLNEIITGIAKALGTSFGPKYKVYDTALFPPPPFPSLAVSLLLRLHLKWHGYKALPILFHKDNNKCNASCLFLFRMLCGIALKVFENYV